MLESLEACQLCGAKKFLGLDGIIRKPDPRKAKLGLREDSTVFYCCLDCSFIFQNPRPSQKFVEDYYANSTYHTAINQDISEGQIGHSLISLARFDAFLQLNGIRLTDFRGKTCLDFGCGIGGALSFLANAGNDVYGVELDRREQEFGRRHYPAVKFLSSTGEIPANTRFDFIFSHHSLEHVFDPNEFLAYASRALGPDGTLMVVVPSWRWSTTKDYMSGFDISHNSMFDHISLAGFQNKYGLYVYSYMYHNSGDWEIITLARKSPARNHYSFTMDDILSELYENIGKRDADRKEMGSVRRPLDPIIVRN